MKTLIHTVLAALLLISTMGVSVNKHYCHGHLIGVTVLGTPSGCCDGKVKMPKGCCEDEVDFHQVEDDFVSTSFLLDGSIYFAVLPLAVDFAEPDLSEGFQQPEYLNYKPPLLHPDVQVWVQTFLI